MAGTTPTGLHTPVTNIVATEATVSQEMIAEGDPGVGDALPIPPDGAEERIVRPESASAANLILSAPETGNLRDIGEASFGPPPAFEAVIGTDERVRITETNKLPWRLSASLLITGADNSQWIGTGWFISPRTLVTAGHVVYIKHSGVPGRDGFVKKIQVMPGRDASERALRRHQRYRVLDGEGVGETGTGELRLRRDHLAVGVSQLPSATSDLACFQMTCCSAPRRISAAIPATNRSGTFWFDSRQDRQHQAGKGLLCGRHGRRPERCLRLHRQERQANGRGHSCLWRCHGQFRHAHFQRGLREPHILETHLSDRGDSRARRRHGRPSGRRGRRCMLRAAPRPLPDIAQLTDDRGRLRRGGARRRPLCDRCAPGGGDR